jgi:hypothetical protein
MVRSWGDLQPVDAAEHGRQAAETVAQWLGASIHSTPNRRRRYRIRRGEDRTPWIDASGWN